MPSLVVADCEGCGYEVDTDFGYCCDECDTWRCEDCGSCECSDDSDYRSRDCRVREYYYRPTRFRPKGNFQTDALLGLELEVSGSQSDIADVVERFDSAEDHLYMKQDSSIDGVEIVTHPMTLAYARQYRFGNLLRELRCVTGDLDDDYGLHVHVSREAFRRGGKPSASHQMTWLLFMYRNADHLEMLARRSGSRWAAFHKPGRGELARKARAVQSDDRYVAVNCNNATTYELRFFKSTLDETEFYAALEFADASVRYTRAIPIHDVLRGKAMTWRHFSAWVERRNYRHLSAEISQ